MRYGPNRPAAEIQGNGKYDFLVKSHKFITGISTCAGHNRSRAQNAS